tara:strand:+ start:2632 stop:2760 length:129 start_codon:yes stop_codon:yes gene_type:complete
MQKKEKRIRENRVTQKRKIKLIQTKYKHNTLHNINAEVNEIF